MKINCSLWYRLLGGLALAAACPLFALQGGAVMPEYVQFEPADAPDIVNLNTGDFSYTLPLGEVPGPYGSFPLSMSYHPAIGPNQEATWVGLGWTFNPGAINRNMRGTPDDQFHGGELAFLYSYAKSSNWGVSVGYSYGAFSVNMTYNTASGYGVSVGYGLQLGIFNLGGSFGTNGIGLGVGMGITENLSVQGGISFNSEGYQGSSFGLAYSGQTANGGTVTASMGVHHTSGQGMSAASGVGYSPKIAGYDKMTSNQKTFARNRSESGIQFSDGSISVKGAGFGTSVSMPGSGIGVASSNGASSSKNSSTGFAAVLPTPVGIFSFGYSRSIQESWVRQATSEYLYGYMYQGGPAIFTDKKTDDMDISGSSGTGPTSMWSWNYKGKSLDRVGNPTTGDLLPAYDLFGVAANGLSGTFRAYGMTQHSLYESVELLDDDDAKAQSLYYLLKEDGSTQKQYDTEFPVNPSTVANSADFSKYAYDHCYDAGTQAASFNTSDNASKLNDVIAGRCSRYSILASRHLNEANRLVLSSDSESTVNIRSRMLFRFMGEAGGFFKSELPNRKTTEYGKEELDPDLFQKTVNGSTYGLFGGRRIDPILEGGMNNGRLKGFKITNSDGAQFFFTQPVRAIISADYTTNQAKGAPLFVDKHSPGSADNFLDVIANAFKSAYEFGGTLVDDPLQAFEDMTGWYWKSITFPWNAVGSFLWSSPKFKDNCEANKPDEQYNFSYSMKVNPYATQWLLTEVRGPEFVLLSKTDMTKNIGYQVKFTYAEPTWYKWRFPFAPPATDKAELPNFRLPKNAKTPENCHSDMYQGSFGVKELVYLASIETASHKADFVLNDKDDPRQDGKGWIQDWTGRTQATPGQTKQTAMPIYLDVQMEMKAAPVSTGSQVWVKKCRNETRRDGANTILVGRTCWWERNLDYAFAGAYMNVMPTKTQIDRMIGKKLAIGGVDPASSDSYVAPGLSATTGALPTGFVFTGLANHNLANPAPGKEPPVVYGIAPAIGKKLSLGSSLVTFQSQITVPQSPYSTDQSSDNYRNVYRVGMNSCPTASCDPFASAYNPPNPTAPPDAIIPAPLVTMGGAGGGLKKPVYLQPLLVYNDFVETTGDDDNVMRKLEKIVIKDKTGDIALRQFEFDYDNEIAPGTLNSYDVPRDPITKKAIRTGGKLDLASEYPKSENPTMEELGGKLKLKSVREVACLSSDCSSKAPMPPFKFFYKNEKESSFKQAADFYGTIIASSSPQDEWGMWNKHATLQNHKVRQDFATYGAVSWSMDKIVDPAGGALEVEYERDTYKGESYPDDTKDYPVSWRRCPNVDGMNPDHLCIDVLPRRWEAFCNRNDQLEGEYKWKPTGPTTPADYAYLSELYSDAGLTNPIIDKQIYFMLDANFEFEVGCGPGVGGWSAGSCYRNRAVGTLGSGHVKSIHTYSGVRVPFLDANVYEVRTIELDVSVNLVLRTLHNTGEILTRHSQTDIDPLKGLIWIKNVKTDLKGGDLRVAKLVRKDIGLTQTTKYDYAVGEMAQYPDSVLSTAFAERFSPVKAMSVLPLTYLPGISRVPGISDEEVNFLPSATITYPKVTVTNVSSTGDAILNGKTVYEFMTPESGVPQRQGGALPFMKLKTTLSRLYPEGTTAPAMGSLSVVFKDANNATLGSASMRRLPKPKDSMFVFQNVDAAAYYKNTHSMEFTYSGTDGTFLATVKMAETANPPYKQVFDEYADVQVSLFMDGTRAPKTLSASLSDFKSSRNPPILVRTTPLHDLSTSYADYTAFLGKGMNTEYYRWMPPTPGAVNNPANPTHQDPIRYKLIKADTVIYSSVAPSGDDRFYPLGQTDRQKIGQDEEKWDYMRKIHCKDDLVAKSTYTTLCSDAKYSDYKGIEVTVDGDRNYQPKQMTYSRMPVFMVETRSKSGFNNTQNANEYLITRVTNHRFDPVTGQPTLSATYTGLAGQYAPAKASRNTPAFSVNTPLASTMFERNILGSNMREDAYTWMNAATPNDVASGTFINFDTDDLNTVLPPRLTRVSLTPYSQGYLDYSGTAGAPKPILARDNPILGMGTYTPRFKLKDANGQSELSNNATLFTPSFTDGSFLKKWSGSQVLKVDRWLHPVEESNVYDTKVAKRYDPTGFHQIAVYGNAGYGETALLTAEGRAGNFPDVDIPDAWRFTGGAAATDQNFVKLTGNFTLSHPLDLFGGPGYLVELQAHSSVARTCQVAFSNASGGGDSKTLALLPGLNAYQVSLNGTVANASPPGAGINRVNLSCNGNSGATVKVAYLRAYPERAETISYLYDFRGNMTQSVNEQNVSSYYEYDAFGNLAAIRNDDGVLFSTHKRELTNVTAP